MSKGKLLFLGTSASLGVPVIGCKCPTCQKENRLRPSALLTLNNKVILLDAGPDFRQQALRAKIDHLDGLILTHAHYDHVSGIDDLRAFYFKDKKIIKTLLSKETHEELIGHFSYLAEDLPLNFVILPKDAGNIEFLNLPIGYFSYFQKKMKVNGFKFGTLAYVSDIREYPEDIFSSLKGTEILIISALRKDPTKSHFSIKEALDFASKVKAKEVYFTHIAHDFDKTLIPNNVNMAFDGQEIEFEYE